MVIEVDIEKMEALLQKEEEIAEVSLFVSSRRWLIIKEFNEEFGFRRYALECEELAKKAEMYKERDAEASKMDDFWSASLG